MAQRSRSETTPAETPRLVPVSDNTDVRRVEQAVTALQERVDELEERLHETIVNLEIVVVEGYFAKIWPDLETGEWVGECPAVGACVQETTRKKAIKAIKSMVREVLGALDDWGEKRPQKDL